MDISTGSVLKKYEEKLEEILERFIYGRNPFKTWSRYKIDVLSALMTNSDFFKYLIEVGFVDSSFIKCPDCEGSMEIQRKKKAADGIIWYCDNKLYVVGQGYKRKVCGKEMSVRTNSWFSQSKLTVVEILIVTYHW